MSSTMWFVGQIKTRKKIYSSSQPCEEKTTKCRIVNNITMLQLDSFAPSSSAAQIRHITSTRSSVIWQAELAFIHKWRYQQFEIATIGWSRPSRRVRISSLLARSLVELRSSARRDIASYRVSWTRRVCGNIVVRCSFDQRGGRLTAVSRPRVLVCMTATPASICLTEEMCSFRNWKVGKK